MGILDRLRKDWLKTSVVEHDKFDFMEYSKVFEKSPNMKDVEKSGSEHYEGFSELMKDAFFSLYRSHPELVDAEKIAPAYRFNREQIEKYMETTEYQESRLISRMNEIYSAIGSLVFADGLVNSFQDNPALRDILKDASEAFQSQQEADELKEQIQDLKELAQAANDVGNEKQAKKYEKQMQIAQISLEEAQAKAEAKAVEVAAKSQANQSAMRQSVRQAARQSKKEVFETSETIDAWGIGGEGFQTLPVETKLQLAEVLVKTPKFKKMATLFGRFRNLAKAKQKAKLKQHQPELHGITVGRDIERLLPSELVLAGSEETKPLFYKKFLGRSFLQYSLKSKDKAGRGPLVVLVDVSGSTAGEIEEFEKAVALGLREIASKHRRAFAVVFFSDQPNLKVLEFGPKEYNPIKILELAAYFENGGTNFEKPLQKGIELLQKAEYKNGDLVMLTDGQCTVSTEFLKVFQKIKREKGFRVYTIVINKVGRNTLTGVKPFSDQAVLLSELTDEAAGDLFEAI